MDETLHDVGPRESSCGNNEKRYAPIGRILEQILLINVWYIVVGVVVMDTHGKTIRIRYIEQFRSNKKRCGCS